MKTTQKLILGAHESISGGIDQAYYRAASIGCTAVQFFTHSNRQWGMKPLSSTTLEAVKVARRETGIEHAVVHASYLINLGSESKETLAKSITCLQKELEQCHELSIEYLVLHPGGGNSNEQACMQQISQALDAVFEIAGGNTVLLLETMAGQGSQVGYRFEQLAQIKSNSSHKNRIAYCIDTCHLWAAGYDFSTEKGYISVFDEWEKVLGPAQIKAIHMNDSKQRLGSRVDRHEDIGKGTIGLEGFRLLMNDPRFSLVPKILETPKKIDLEDDIRNLKVLKELVR